MSDVPVKHGGWVLIAKPWRTLLFAFSAFRKRPETLELLSNLLLACRMWHPMPMVEIRATVILFLIFWSLKYQVYHCTSFIITGFRRRKSTVDQVDLLTQNIEDSFEAKKKAGALFVDLTAVYDTVWCRGLTSKMLRLLPDKHMVKMIMELVRNRSFTLATVDSKQSRLRHLKTAFLRDQS